jgi:hypothetical protein
MLWCLSNVHEPSVAKYGTQMIRNGVIHASVGAPLQKCRVKLLHTRWRCWYPLNFFMIVIEYDDTALSARNGMHRL